MKIFNKYYRYLRSNVFNDLSTNEFLDVYANFNRLAKQYKLLKICNRLENINIKIIPFPILRFLSMLLDFLRWKLYDIFMSFIIGREFDFFGVTMFCR